MEVENMTDNRRDDDDDVPLPGFRFHPTDEELVGFYLRRKVEKRPISIELIKQIDIYKHDPWDLPKASNVGDKEWYFFCKRGRKYRNSIRPNRVTGSGFWKATGIDRPIYSAAGEGKDCIGLKKSLVYYRGSAGKGTKTDWMMHEFRLPPNNVKTTKHIDDNTIAQEAEVWTLCRILKRTMSNKKCIPDWREVSSAAAKRVADASSKTCSSVESENCQGYISFRSAPVAAANIRQNMEKKPFANNHHHHVVNEMNVNGGQLRSEAPTSTANSYNYSSFLSPDVNDYLLKHGDWDELKSFVEFAADPFLI